MSASRSCRTTCARSLYADLLCIYLCVRISASGSCMTPCARSLYADLLRKISLSGCLQQDPVGPLVQDLSPGSPVQDLPFRIAAGPLVEDPLPDYTNATLPTFRAMDTSQRAALRNQKLQLYLHSAHSTRSISTEGYTLRNQKSQLYLHFVRWTRTISAEGCTSKSENATLKFTCIP